MPDDFDPESHADSLPAEPLEICGVVGYPEAGRVVCELPRGHEGYHRDGHVRWLGYHQPNMHIDPARV